MTAGERTAPVRAASGPPGDPAGVPLVRRVGGSALNLVAKYGLLTLISAITTVVITRLLHPAGYGVYGSAVATSAVLGAVADFGFSMMLSRDMADRQDAHRSLLRAAYEVAILWSALLTLIMVGLAFTAPISSQRGQALLILAPAMLFNGLNPAGVVFLVRYETGLLLKLQAVVAILQMLTTIAVAAAGLGPVGVAGAVSAWGIAGNILQSFLANRLLPASADRFSRRELIRRAAPLGVMSIMVKVYLTIDLVLLGWYVAGTRLGDYAAASKLLTVIAALAGVVMGGALPALATTARDRQRRGELLERVWHWLMVCAVPCFVALALFAPVVIKVSVGDRYHGAIALMRILSIAGAVTVISNLIGNLMVAMHRIRQLLLQNSAAIVVNIGGNVILIPHYGVYAAAWMTVVTEILVCSCSLFTLRHDLEWMRLFRVSARPAAAIAFASLVALLQLHSQWLALGLAAVAFPVALTAFGGWPVEFKLPVRRAARTG